MIAKLVKPDVEIFDKYVLQQLGMFFDLNLSACTAELRQLWFRNLLTLAQHDLSIAHCIQHNHVPRVLIDHVIGEQVPECYDPVYGKQIGCYSGWKKSDSMTLSGNTLSGTKHWISLVDQADFGVFKVKCSTTEAYVMLDFDKARPTIDMSHANPIGMSAARPGSIIVDNFDLPDQCVLGHKNFYENPQKFFFVSNFIDYSFITNYVGLITALYQDLTDYVKTNDLDTGFELKKLELKVSTVQLLWEDHLPSVNLKTGDDVFWHGRNTQYAFAKTVLLEMINLTLQICDSSWLDARHKKNQRFRDALTFCSHMRPLERNLQEKILFGSTTI